MNGRSTDPRKSPMETNIKAVYSWHTTANTMLRRRKAHNLSDTDLAEWYDMQESAVRNLLDMRNYAAEYLRSRHKENHWSLLSGSNRYAFEAIVESRPKLTTTGEKELFKEAAYLLIDNPHTGGGRLY